MHVKGRRVAIGAVVVGAIVILLSGFAFERKVREQWYLWKLESAEEDERELAAEKLGEMRSRRAIPQLVEILRQASKLTAFSPDGRRVEVNLAIWDVATATRIHGFAVRPHYSFKALVRIGRPATPALLRLLEDSDERIRSAAAAALNEIDPQGDEEVSALPVIDIDSLMRRMELSLTPPRRPRR